LCALVQHYREKVVDAGPTLTSGERLSGSIRLHFTHVDGGLVEGRNEELVEAAGVELNKRFCLCNLQILNDRKNQKNHDSQVHRTVIVQSMRARFSWRVSRFGETKEPNRPQVGEPSHNP